MSPDRTVAETEIETETENDYPAVDSLQHGDIVMPKPEGTSAIGSVPEFLREWVRRIPQTRKSWQAVLNAYSQTKPEAQSDGTAKPAFSLVDYWPRLLDHLGKMQAPGSTMTVLEFIVMVMDELAELGVDLNPQDLSRAVIGKQYVGHCGIVDAVACDGAPWVVESSHTFGGIRSVPYLQWEAERRVIPAKVWVYRLKALNIPEGAEHGEIERIGLRRKVFVDTAHRYRMQGVPYGIFDGKFDGSKLCLQAGETREPGNPLYLYCSELVLVCARQVLGVDLCELTHDRYAGSNPNFRMFTPKDLCESKHVMPIFEPGGAPLSTKKV